MVKPLLRAAAAAGGVDVRKPHGGRGWGRGGPRLLAARPPQPAAGPRHPRERRGGEL